MLKRVNILRGSLFKQIIIGSPGMKLIVLTVREKVKKFKRLFERRVYRFVTHFIYYQKYAYMLSWYEVAHEPLEAVVRIRLLLWCGGCCGGGGFHVVEVGVAVEATAATSLWTSAPSSSSSPSQAIL